VQRIKTYLEMIKIEHSVFALPFAYLGLLIASRGLPSWKVFLAITFAMVSARTFGMTVNRLVDRETDSKNVRTQTRALPQGLLSFRFIWISIIISTLVFIVCISFLPPICWLLSPLALMAMWVYPYLKRFTWGCHWFLGLILAMAPIGGWLAVRESYPYQARKVMQAIWGLGQMMFSKCIVIFDKKEKLYSVPVRWGIDHALRISQILHLITLLSFAFVLVSISSGIWGWAGFSVIGFIILQEHRLLKDHGLAKLETAFFKFNAWISMIFFGGIFLDYLI